MYVKQNSEWTSVVGTGRGQGYIHSIRHAAACPRTCKISTMLVGIRSMARKAFKSKRRDPSSPAAAAAACCASLLLPLLPPRSSSCVGGLNFDWIEEATYLYGDT